MMHGHYHDNIQHHVQKALHGKHAKISKHLSKKKDGRNPDHPGGVSWMHRARLLHPKQKVGKGQKKRRGKRAFHPLTKHVKGIKKHVKHIARHLSKKLRAKERVKIRSKSQKKKLGKKKQAKSSIQ